MTKIRIKLTTPVVDSRADAEKYLGLITAETASLNQLKAQLDVELTAVRAGYEGHIDALDKSITTKTGLLQQWAEANPEEFGDKKSITFLHGVLGFRTGNKQLKTLTGWTWSKVLGVLDNAFVRVKREPDKEGLLAAHARGEIDEAGLRAAGPRVVQEESFFVEPAVQEAAGTVTTAA